jgi:hypothetical protein
MANRSRGGRGGRGNRGGGGSGGSGGSDGKGGSGGYGRRTTVISGGQTQYFIPGTEEFGVPMGYRRADGSYVTGLRNAAGQQIVFRSDRERADYEFEARMQAQIHRRQEEAAANARKAYLELAGSIAVVREAMFVLAKTYEPLIAESRAFKDAQRQLAESAAFSGMSFKELTKIQQEAMRSLQINAKTAAEVVSVMSQLSAQAGQVGKTMENVSGLFDLATARGLTLKEAVLGMKQALSGSLEGTPLADKLFMKDLRAVLSDYAQTIGKRTLFDLTQTEKATAVMKEFERQVALVSGSYERFLETTSGKQAIFTERIEEFAAAIGHRLDRALSSVQNSLSSVISLFMELDKSTGGVLSSFTSFLMFAGTVRVVLMGLVGTLTAVTHSLKSLNIEVGNTTKVITFLQQRAILITTILTGLIAVFSAFGDSVEQSSLSLKEALVPLDEYIKKTNEARASLETETAAINENTSAIKRNRQERENRAKLQVEVRRGIAADIDLVLQKLQSDKLTQSQKEDAVMELVRGLYSDSGGWSGQITGNLTAFVKKLFGKEDELSRGEISAQVLGQFYKNMVLKFQKITGVDFPFANDSNVIVSDDDFKRVIDAVKSQLSLLPENKRDDIIMSAIARALVSTINEQRPMIAGAQDVLKGIEQAKEIDERVKKKPMTERYVVADGKVHISDDAGVGFLGGRVKRSNVYDNAVEVSLKDFIEIAREKGTVEIVDADTLKFSYGGVSVNARLAGIDAFEIVPRGGQLPQEARKALLQMAQVTNFDYSGQDKIEPGTFIYAAKELSKRFGFENPIEFFEQLKQGKIEKYKDFPDVVKSLIGKPVETDKTGNFKELTKDEAELVAIASVLGTEQVKILKDILLKRGITGVIQYKPDVYGRSLIIPKIGETPLQGLALATGVFAYMESISGKGKEISHEERELQKAVESLRSYLPDKSRRGGRVAREKMRRVPNEYMADDFEVEMMRLEAQDERFRRDNAPEVLKSVMSDLNYQTSYVSSMNRMLKRAEERVEKRALKIEELKNQLKEAERVRNMEEASVLKVEIERAEQKYLETKEAFGKLESKVKENIAVVEQLTPIKIGRTIGDLVRKGELTQEGAKLSFREAFGYTIRGADKGIVMGINEELAQAFDYMMSLPEEDRERVKPAFEAYVASVRAGRMSQLSQAAVSIFQSGNIIGAGDMSTRGLALAGALSAGFTQASSRFVSGVFSAIAGGKELDSQAVFELKELEYRKKREALLQEDFETEKERRLRLQVLEEERAKYLESQVDTFGSRLKTVFSETADFAGQVFNQVLTQLLVSSMTQGAGRSLLSAALSFIPGGSAIAGFLGLSSGGVIPGGSVAVVGENPDGTLNRTSEIVATRGVARVFNNMQTNRIVNQLGLMGNSIGGFREVKMEAKQVELLSELVRETKRAMVMTEAGGEVLAKRSMDYVDYRNRFIERY